MSNIGDNAGALRDESVVKGMSLAEDIHVPTFRRYFMKTGSSEI